MAKIPGMLTLDAPQTGHARLRLAGHLDDEAARDLLHAAADVVRGGCLRLVVDLDGLTGFDERAAYALTGCARLDRFVPDGVRVVATVAPGTALLARAGATSSPSGAGPDIMAACPAY